MWSCRGLAVGAVGMLSAALALGPIAADTTVAGAAGTPTLQANGSVDEAWLTGATPGDSIVLKRDGARVDNSTNPGRADALGSLIIRDLTPGSGYSWDDTTSHARSA